jgi:hypothetical protein
MLNFRYHALSLVAVFLALVIGLLLGVAIGDKGLVSSAEKDVRASLRGDVRNAQQQRNRAQDKVDQRAKFEAEAYPALVANRLQGRRIALIELGGASERMWNLTRDAILPAGAKLASISVIREPLQLEALAKAAKGTRYDTLDVDQTQLHSFGARLGIQFTQQGGGALLNAVRHDLLAQGSGDLSGADGVVVVKDPTQLDGAAATIAQTFEDGLMAGLRANQIPVVGVEATDTDPSQVPWFTAHDVSSVDDLDDAIGRAALVFALLPGQRGAFGQKPTANGGLLPPLV